MPSSVLLAIPVFNEVHHIDAVLRCAQAYIQDILVINDGSTDGTGGLLRRRTDVRVISHPENRGYGQSIAAAFDFAVRGGFRWLVTMDCDEQHKASHIPRFIVAALEDDSDLVSGTRYPLGRRIPANVPTDRLAINRTITQFLNRRLGLRITDAFCGFKAYRVSALRHFHITVPGYAMPLQLWVQAVRSGLRIREIPVDLIYNNPDRHFGGWLDDPEARLQHYQAVFEAELARRGAVTGDRQVNVELRR